MNDTRCNKKDKNQHIQVFVRVRPINSSEKAGKSLLVVDAPTNKDVIVRERPQDKLTKKFTFDKVFGPLSKQVDVYNAVVSPLLDEVLAGYNCTVFAYGQTGTGKTFTMEGVGNDPSLHWKSDTSAGIIPRALSHLFDELRILEAQEYSVRVSFLELYNEELFDLLSPSDDASKIRLYEDASKKGAVIIHGLEEVTVHNKSEVYKILEKGSEKRQTAATLMNAQSSRSHTVFSITVHIKENTVDGEELLKTGKLNLVDLAGSENVGRSGAVDRRAREAGNINQSLLTLGRVITALVERAPHIPYRESKLTRLLQESLGGRTKTSIIATVSPASINLEETLSTLDYAHRAKNITNRPEINQKLSKKAVLKEYTEEIERLRRDLLATRERNGVYLAQENYNEMQNLIEIQGKEIEEKINHIKALEETMHRKEKLFNDLRTEYEMQTNVLHKTKNTLLTTKHRLNETVFERDLQKHLVEKHVTTEQVLMSQAKTLVHVADTASKDTQLLHEKIIRKSKVEDENENMKEKFKEDMSKRFRNIEQDLSIHRNDIVEFCDTITQQITEMNEENNEEMDTINLVSKALVKQESEISRKLTESVNKSGEDYCVWIDEQIKCVSSMAENETDALNKLTAQLAPKIKELVEHKIAENLKALNERMMQRTLIMTNRTKKFVESRCSSLLEEHDRLAEQVASLQKTIEVSNEKVEEFMLNEQKLSTTFDELRRQMGTAFQQYDSYCHSKADFRCFIKNSLGQMNTTCNEIREESKNKYDSHVSTEKAFEEQSWKDIKSVQKEISTSLEKNWNLAEAAVLKSHDVVKALESGTCVTRNALSNYHDKVMCNTTHLQELLEEGTNSVLSSVDEYHKMVSVESSKHVAFVESLRSKINKETASLSEKFSKTANASNELSDNIASNVCATKRHVDKFLVEDLRKDVPTGTTPSRREFSFPRELASTSPHARIIERFKETRKQVEDSEDDEDTIVCENGLSPSVSVTDRSIACSTPQTPTPKRIKVTSTPYDSRTSIPVSFTNGGSNPSFMKAASTSDLSIIPKESMESVAHSESELFQKHSNKENGAQDFAKPGKPKQLSKTKSFNRKILGSWN